MTKHQKSEARSFKENNHDSFDKKLTFKSFSQRRLTKQEEATIEIKSVDSQKYHAFVSKVRETKINLLHDEDDLQENSDVPNNSDREMHGSNVVADRTDPCSRCPAISLKKVFKQKSNIKRAKVDANS